MKPWRTDVVVMAVHDGPGMVEVVVPAWRVSSHVLVPLSSFPVEIQPRLKPGECLTACVHDFNAVRSTDLRLSDWSLRFKRESRS